LRLWLKWKVPETYGSPPWIAEITRTRTHFGELWIADAAHATALRAVQDELSALRAALMLAMGSSYDSFRFTARDRAGSDPT
jgi:hypothetical protein